MRAYIHRRENNHVTVHVRILIIVGLVTAKAPFVVEEWKWIRVSKKNER